MSLAADAISLQQEAQKAYLDGDLEKAGKLYAEAIKESRKAPANSNLARLLANYACVKRDQKNYTEAESLFEQALSVNKEELKSQTESRNYILKQYAALFRKINRPDVAEHLEKSSDFKYASIEISAGSSKQEKVSTSSSRTRSKQSTSNSGGVTDKDQEKEDEFIEESSTLKSGSGKLGTGIDDEDEDKGLDAKTEDSDSQIAAAAEKSKKKPLDNSGSDIKDDDDDAYKVKPGPTIYMRIMHFNSTIAAPGEQAFEAMLTANNMLDGGNQVVIFLDQDGVNLANRHNIQQFQVMRGSTGKMIAPNELLRQFIQKGGKVYASWRACKTQGLLDSGIATSLVDGVKVLQDPEFSQELAKSRGAIMDY
jgi:predicted peroxiredoxin